MHTSSGLICGFHFEGYSVVSHESFLLAYHPVESVHLVGRRGLCIRILFCVVHGAEVWPAVGLNIPEISYKNHFCVLVQNARRKVSLCVDGWFFCQHRALSNNPFCRLQNRKTNTWCKKSIDLSKQKWRILHFCWSLEICSLFDKVSVIVDGWFFRQERWLISHPFHQLTKIHIYHQFNVLQLYLCFCRSTYLHSPPPIPRLIEYFGVFLEYKLYHFVLLSVYSATESLAKYPLTITCTLFYTMYIHYCSCRTTYVVVWWVAWKSHMIVVCACSGVLH
jgi:hypothetical protein